jgi:hypothetical protein
MYHFAGYNSCMSHSYRSTELLCVGLFAWIILALILASVRQDRRTGGKTPTEIAFRAPLTGRIFMLMIAVFAVAAWPLMYVGGIFGDGAAMTADTWFLFGLLELMCLAIGVPIYYASGPNDLLINLDQRTYRLVHGWPHNTKVQTGPMADLAGVFVYCRQINVDYRVGIVWKHDWKSGRKWFVVLGMFNRSGQADRLAEETAATLGLPLVEPPAPFKSSTSIRNGLG